MRSFLIHWLFTGIALGIAAHFVPGIVVSSTAALVFGALVLGLVNAVVRPVLVVLTLPITVVTIGLFYLIVNGAAFALAAGLVPGFAVASFGSAVGGALAVSVVSFLLGWLLRPHPDAEWRNHPGA
jgi:putative membrane protein